MQGTRDPDCQRRRSSTGGRRCSAQMRRSGVGLRRRRSLDAEFEGETRAFFRFCVGKDSDDESFVSLVSSEGSDCVFLSIPGSQEESPRRLENYRIDDSDDEPIEEDSQVIDDQLMEDNARKLWSHFEIHGDDSDNEASSFSSDASDRVENMYDFKDEQMKKILEALKTSDGEELVKVMESAMADNLEKRLLGGGGGASGSSSPIAGGMSPFLAEKTLSGLQTPTAPGSISGRMTPAMAAGSVSARMTPRRLSGITSPRPNDTPQRSPGTASFAEEVSMALQASTEKQNRRASVKQTPELYSAVKRLSMQQTSVAHKAVRRLSLQASPMSEASGEGDAIDEETRRQMRQLEGAAKRKRKSILAAAEVLAMADGEDFQDSAASVDDRLLQVQHAIETARRNHRQSIALAVRNCEAEEVSDKNQPATNVLSRDRIEKIVAAAHFKFQEEKTKKGRSCHVHSSVPDTKKTVARPEQVRALLNTRVDGVDVHCGPPKRKVAGKARARPQYGNA